MKATFHASLPCKNIEETINFYADELGFEIGRKTHNWVDVNLFDNQLTFVLVDKFNFEYPNYLLEKETLPSFHFGVILSSEEWEEVFDRINRWSIDTVIKTTFFEDQNGEQHSFFIQDPNGYYIEFKTFKERGEIFM